MDAATEALLSGTGLAGESHSIDEDWLARVLEQDYGLVGDLLRLRTEKDVTYRLRGTDAAAGGEFLVKVSHPEEPVDGVRCQLDAVDFIERTDQRIPVQSILRASDGRSWRRLIDETGEFAGILRVHRFIPGSLLADEDPAPKDRRAVGAMLGRVDAALGSFEHPGDEPVLAWDLGRFLALEPLIDLEGDEGRRALASEVFAAFRERVQPHLATARTQVLHGDFSPHNVVVDSATEGYVTGVIDFGDIMRGPVVFDPAVMLGNHLLSAPRAPWPHARDLLDGYRSVFPLNDQEVALVAVASVARVTLRALLATWRIERGSDRADYVRQHAAHDWGRVANALDFGFDAAHAFLMHEYSPHDD